MILPIVKWPDKRLNTKSVEVLDSHKRQWIQDLIDNMIETMYDAKGLGLSAIQVGHPIRLFVMDIVGCPDTVFINPVIVGWASKRGMVNEGCLSLPGVVEEVSRFPGVSVMAVDRYGQPFARDFTETPAQCVQHEVDHLNGATIVDGLPSGRLEAIRLIMKERR